MAMCAFIAKCRTYTQGWATVAPVTYPQYTSWAADPRVRLVAVPKTTYNCTYQSMHTPPKVQIRRLVQHVSK